MLRETQAKASAIIDKLDRNESRYGKNALKIRGACLNKRNAIRDVS